MSKINRLGWTAGFSFSKHGVSIGVRVLDPAILPDVIARVPVGARLGTARTVEHLYSIVTPRAPERVGQRRFHLLYVDSARVTRTIERLELLADVERYLEQTLLVAATRRLFLHAGVVGWRGRALVLPGDSYSGKTTLVVELLRLGARYYSDEYAVLDANGRVHPYPRPLKLRLDGEPLARVVAPEALGTVGRRPLPVTLVALCRYRTGARFRPRTLAPGAAMLELLSHAPTARLRPRGALGMLQPLVRRARVVRGVRGEASATAAELLEAMEMLES
jgi:hypothetical protein